MKRFFRALILTFSLFTSSMGGQQAGACAPPPGPEPQSAYRMEAPAPAFLAEDPVRFYAEAAQADWATVSAEGLYLDLPAHWEKTVYGDVTVYGQALLSLGFHTIQASTMTAGGINTLEDYHKLLTESDEVGEVYAQYYTLDSDSHNAMRARYDSKGPGGQGYTFEVVLVDTGEAWIMFNTQYESEESAALLDTALRSIRTQP